MTHYTIDYTTLTPNDAHNKAIADIREYMGESKYSELTTMFSQHPPMSMEQFQYYNMLTGISGYPLYAWHEECWPYG